MFDKSPNCKLHKNEMLKEKKLLSHGMEATFTVILTNNNASRISVTPQGLDNLHRSHTFERDEFETFKVFAQIRLKSKSKRHEGRSYLSNSPPSKMNKK